VNAQRDLGTATKGSAARVLDDLEALGVGLALEHPLLGLVGRLARDGDPVGDEERRVEAEAELADQVAAVALLEVLEELGRARARDRAEVRGELLLGHADARVCVRTRIISLRSRGRRRERRRRERRTHPG